MTTDNGNKREPFQIKKLHPIMQRPIGLLMTTLMEKTFHDGLNKFKLMPFEGFRSAERQNYLFAEGKATKARPWESSHQYGLAVDFACQRIENNMGIPGGWFWADGSHECWAYLKRRAAIDGLEVPITWDHGHVQHPLWREVKRALNKREWNWVA